MNAKILKVCLTLFALIILSGCTREVKVPVYVDREVEVLVPQKCTLAKPKCEFNAETYTEIVANMLKCVYDYDVVLKKCKGEK
jgi:hypothetical protein